MCIFCKIINNEIPCFKVYEDERVLAFLDINPATEGHTLIIPKSHASDIFEISSEDLQAISAVALKIARDYKLIFPDMKGINLINSSGKEAGQEVFHFHLHLVPRYNSDELKFQRNVKDKIDPALVFERIKKYR